jgi:hypothetical protein
VQAAMEIADEEGLGAVTMLLLGRKRSKVTLDILTTRSKL